jgi:hypothetical protein
VFEVSPGTCQREELLCHIIALAVLSRWLFRDYRTQCTMVGSVAVLPWQQLIDLD